MNHSFKTLAAVSVLAMASLASAPAMAELSANVGVNSNYIWRGVTQTDDEAAISGGLDFAHDSGIYLGTWTSSLGGDGQYELDLYGGYAGEVGAVSYDLGVISYLYPVGDDELDFTEIYGNLGFGPITAGIAYTVDKEAGGDENDLYYSLGANFEVKEGLSLGALVGYYDFEDDSVDDYSHYQVSLTKSAGDFGDFTFAVDKNDIDDGSDIDDTRVSIGWSKSFDL